MASADLLGQSMPEGGRHGSRRHPLMSSSRGTYGNHRSGSAGARHPSATSSSGSNGSGSGSGRNNAVPGVGPGLLGASPSGYGASSSSSSNGNYNQRPTDATGYMGRSSGRYRGGTINNGMGGRRAGDAGRLGTGFETGIDLGFGDPVQMPGEQVDHAEGLRGMGILPSPDGSDYSPPQAFLRAPRTTSRFAGGRHDRGRRLSSQMPSLLPQASHRSRNANQPVTFRGVGADMLSLISPERITSPMRSVLGERGNPDSSSAFHSTWGYADAAPSVFSHGGAIPFFLPEEMTFPLSSRLGPEEQGYMHASQEEVRYNWQSHTRNRSWTPSHRMPQHHHRHRDRDHRQRQQQQQQQQTTGHLLPSLSATSGFLNSHPMRFVASDAELSSATMDSGLHSVALEGQGSVDPRVQMALQFHRRQWDENHQQPHGVSSPDPRSPMIAMHQQMTAMQQRHRWADNSQSMVTTPWVTRHRDEAWYGQRRNRHRNRQHHPVPVQEDYGMELDGLGTWMSTSDEEFRDELQPMEEWLSYYYWITSEDMQPGAEEGMPANLGSRARSPGEGSEGGRWVLNRHLELSRRAGRVHRRQGLCAEVFDALPQEVFEGAVKGTKDGAGGSRPSTQPALEQEECPVCLEVFEKGKTLLRLPCRHLFHKECIRPWFQSDCRCPYCRSEVPGSRSEGEAAEEEGEGEGEEEMMLDGEEMEFVENGIDEDSSSEETDSDLDGPIMLNIEALIAEMDLGPGREAFFRTERRPWR